MTGPSSSADRGPRRRRFARFHARLARSEGGATAVEFGIIAIPFFMLLFGILELGMIFVLSTALDNATQTVSRRIRTGAFETSSDKMLSADQMKTAICAKLGWIGTADCGAALVVDVRTFATFDEVLVPPPAFDADGKLVSTWQKPASASIVLVRAYYPWQLITPLLTQAVKKTPDGKALVISTLVFRNEPY